MGRNTQTTKPRKIDWSAANDFINQFKAAQHYKKPKVAKRTRRDGDSAPKERKKSHQEQLLDKHIENEKIRKRVAAEKDSRRVSLRRDFKAFRRWEKFVKNEVKNGEMGIDEYGLMDTDYTHLIPHFGLDELPHQGKREVLDLFRQLTRQAWKNMGPDFHIPLFQPMPDEWMTDHDEFLRALNMHN